MAIVDPTDVTGLFAWYDFSDSSTLYDATTAGSLVAADGNIARIEDKSGNSHHMIENSAGLGPTRKTAIQNGLDVGRFNGSTEWLVSNEAATVWQFLGSGAQTVFVIFSPTATNVAGLLFGTTASVASVGFGSYVRWDDRAASGFSEAGAISARTSSAPVSASIGSCFPSGEWNLVSWFYDADDTDIASRAGMGDLLSRTPAFSDAGSNDAKDSTTLSRTARIGAGQNSGGTDTLFFGGDIGEIAVYNTLLSVSDRLLVTEYLYRKWRLKPLGGDNTASVTLTLKDPGNSDSVWASKTGLAVDVSEDRDSAPFYSATGQITNGSGELAISATNCPLAAGTRTVWIRITDSDGTAGSSGNDSVAFYAPVSVTVA